MATADVILIKYEADMADLKKELQLLTASNTKLTKQVQDFGTAAKKSTDEAAKGAKKFGDESKSLSGTLNSLKGQIAAAFSVQAIINFNKESVKLAAAAEGVEIAFNRIAPAGTLNKLREATKNTVDDVKLMTTTIKASNFGIPVEELGTLFEFAQRRAQETGENVDYLVESIVLGISRKSIPILDNLGLSATRVRDKFKEVGGAEVDVGEAAKAVGMIAREELDSMGEKIDTTIDKFQAWEAMINRTKVSFGDFTITFGTWLGTVVQNFSWRDILPMGMAGGDAFAKADKAIADLQKNEERLLESNRAYFGIQERLKDITTERLKQMLTQRTEAIKNNQVTEDGIGIIQGEVRAITELINTREQAQRQAEQELEYQQKSKAELEKLAEEGDDLATKELKRRDKLKKAHDEYVKNEIEGLNKVVKQTNIAFDAIEDRQKQRFINGEITEEELNRALDIIQQQRLANQLSALRKQNVQTAEAQEEKKNMLRTTEGEITDQQVQLTQKRLGDQEKADEEAKKLEKDRLAQQLKEYEKYWLEIETLNVQFLQQGVYTQEEFDALQAENKKQQLQGTIKVLENFDAQYEENQQEVNDKLLDNEKKLNDAIIEENKRKNDEVVDADKKAAEQRKQAEQLLISETQQLFGSLVQFRLTQSKMAADAEIDILKTKLDQQLENESLNEEEKEELQRQFEERRRQILNEQAQREKQAKIAQAVIDGIVAVIAQSKNGPLIMGLTAAFVAAQIALLAAAPLPQYKEGDVDIQGPGTETSDSILARISRGESVINARATKKHKDMLKAINSDNDREIARIARQISIRHAPEKKTAAEGTGELLVKELARNAKFDDSRIVDTLRRNPPATAKDIRKLGDRMSKNYRETQKVNKLK